MAYGRPLIRINFHVLPPRHPPFRLGAATVTVIIIIFISEPIIHIIPIRFSKPFGWAQPQPKAKTPCPSVKSVFP